MATSCSIVFDNNRRGTYFAGQIVKGKVILKFNKLIHVKAIALYIFGRAETHWTEGSPILSYDGREDYINYKTYLLGVKDGNDQIPMEIGTKTLSFKCRLPAKCPSSFEGNHGHIRYMVKAVLVRPWKFDQSFFRHITVLTVLNLSPLLRTPTFKEIRKTFSCWLGRSQPLTLKVSLPRRGYVPGEIMPVGLLVTNTSPIRVEQLKLTLVLLVGYSSQPPCAESICERFVVRKLLGDEVQRNCTKELTFDLRVPATPPSCSKLCRFIQTTYQIEVEATVKGFHRNAVVRIPVTIGSVPFESQRRRPVKPAPPATEPSLESLANEGAVSVEPPEEQSVPWVLDDSIPPPSYEEAMHIRPDNVNGPQPSNMKDTKAPLSAAGLDEKTFRPVYPVFNMANTTASGAGEGSPKGITERAAVDDDKN